MLSGAQTRRPNDFRYFTSAILLAVNSILPFTSFTVPVAVTYVERDGAFLLDAEGAVEKSKVDEFRTNNLALKNQLAEYAAKYEGIDPDAVKTLLAEKARLEEEKLMSSLIEAHARSARQLDLSQ